MVCLGGRDLEFNLFPDMIVFIGGDLSVKRRAILHFLQKPSKKLIAITSESIQIVNRNQQDNPEKLWNSSDILLPL